MEDIPNAPHLTEFANFTANEPLFGSSPSADGLAPVNGTRAASHEDREEERRLSDDAHMSIQDCGYNSSDSSTQRSASDIAGHDLDDDDDLTPLDSRASSRSSLSSIPDSLKPAIACGADERIRHSWVNQDNPGHGRMEAQFKSIQTIRQREAAFRKPSSVRAMQMHTEDEDDDEFLTPPKRRGGHRMSDISIRSAGSSPLKRSPYYSPTGSTGRQKVKKEYPLVLLHCTLLPPSLPVPGLIGYPDQKILREVLPPEYWRRWKLLEEKVGSSVIRDRGVLISHPEDMYDLLEERLLESLELQRPRLHHGHFLGHENTESEKGDQSATEDSATDDEQGEECPDCGGRFPRHDSSRKWEIKVFAANGLMRAGAWAAAWKEMEKVDVEVGLWLPSEIRRELEKRLLDNDRPSTDLRLRVPQLREPATSITAEFYDHSSRTNTPTPLIHEPRLFAPEEAARPSSPAPAITTPAKAPGMPPPTYSPGPVEEIDLQTLLINYIRVLASDRRNVTIVLLSVLAVYLALGVKPQTSPSHLRPFPGNMFESMPALSSTVSLEQHPTPSWTEQPSFSTLLSLTAAEPAMTAETSAVEKETVREETSSKAPQTIPSAASESVIVSSSSTAAPTPEIVARTSSKTASSKTESKTASLDGIETSPANLDLVTERAEPTCPAMRLAKDEIETIAVTDLAADFCDDD
ncbi:uncharacterized protein P174DRAFT_441040 [Aspergillus novofumigatus IBT 16806]|uniref:Flavoprotein oxygenase n=1 Tax=Aspergillus novofumigatus (strain IBT 16806) TaxID=1392255 RepID=A0A2I1C827_ASPN1|nr:uncharacterized protein P174DRAFT_441040 [Aspergillus novofumigatus IBT 16806]PKX93792.1 hypothetical protein P174DRAFT_441040 [Aspergillus novofumigatus IBT 16806]